jgi:hypothetical protein
MDMSSTRSLLKFAIPKTHNLNAGSMPKRALHLAKLRIAENKELGEIGRVPKALAEGEKFCVG